MADNKTKRAPTVSAREFAASHGVHVKTVHAACRAGLLKFKKDALGFYRIPDGPKNRAAFAKRPAPGRKRGK